MSNDDDDKTIINISSTLQSGGITAHTVNMASPARHINASNAAQIKEVIEENEFEKITVTAALNDAEAFGLASEILELIKSLGYEADGVNQAVWMPPPVGQGVEMKDKELYFWVWNRPL